MQLVSSYKKQRLKVHYIGSAEEASVNWILMEKNQFCLSVVSIPTYIFAYLYGNTKLYRLKLS